MNYKEWHEELQRIFIIAGHQPTDIPDWDAFKESFNDGMTPAEAYLEDLSYAYG